MRRGCAVDGTAPLLGDPQHGGPVHQRDRGKAAQTAMGFGCGAPQYARFDDGAQPRPRQPSARGSPTGWRASCRAAAGVQGEHVPSECRSPRLHLESNRQVRAGSVRSRIRHMGTTIWSRRVTLRVVSVSIMERGVSEWRTPRAVSSRIHAGHVTCLRRRPRAPRRRAGPRPPCWRRCRRPGRCRACRHHRRRAHGPRRPPGHRP